MTISGTAQVGETLTASVSPEGATATYAWQVADAQGGPFSPIPDAAQNTLALQEAQSGKYIKVTATGTGGYAGTVESAVTEAVQAAAQ